MLLLSPSCSSTPLLLLQARPLHGGGQRQPGDAAASFQGCREPQESMETPKEGGSKWSRKRWWDPHPKNITREDNPSALSDGHQCLVPVSVYPRLGMRQERAPTNTSSSQMLLGTPRALPSPHQQPALPGSPVSPRHPHSLAAVPSPALCQGRQCQPRWAVPASSQTLSPCLVTPCSAWGWGWGWGGMECPSIPVVFLSSLTVCQDCCWTLHQDKLCVLPYPGVWPG